MSSPVRQRGSKGATAKSEIDDLPVSKDLRVKGSEPRMILLFRKAAFSKMDQWDKVRDMLPSPAQRTEQYTDQLDCDQPMEVSSMTNREHLIIRRISWTCCIGCGK